jgi:hypothetical protein
MPRLLLIGDSVIDNAAYVRPGEPDVAAQVQGALPDWIVELRAVDGSITEEVLQHQTAGLNRRDLVVVSSGGNDALAHVDLIGAGAGTGRFGGLSTLWQALQSPQDLATGFLGHLHGIQSGFRGTYGALLDRVVGDGRTVLCLTIYNPAFVAHGMSIDQQRAAEVGLSLYNDVIQREALRRGCGVLEMRTLFDDDADFANPIEPSAIGGAKIAAAVARWARENVISSP